MRKILLVTMTLMLTLAPAGGAWAKSTATEVGGAVVRCGVGATLGGLAGIVAGAVVFGQRGPIARRVAAGASAFGCIAGEEALAHDGSANPAVVQSRGLKNNLLREAPADFAPVSRPGTAAPAR